MIVCRWIFGSMEPAFFRGFNKIWEDYSIQSKGQRYTNRTHGTVHEEKAKRESGGEQREKEGGYIHNGEVYLLTKGDNNQVDDRGLYAPEKLWVKMDEAVEHARGFLPYIGMVTIN
uniref:Signal peptidase complex catalytic subunit SEC11 n=1 Tax=Amphimedon queenslandica TaxID=400682 RepID=A0A1X7TLM0_AMPQE